MEGGKGGGVTHIRVHLLRILWKEGGKVQTYQGQSIEDPMERGKEGGFTHIRVHLLGILWREGGGVCKYQGPYIGDPMEREGGLHISGSIY